MRLFLALTLLVFSSLSAAAIKTQEIPYQSADGTKLIGYFAYDDAIKGPRPGVVVVHEWWGLNDYAKRRARDLAELGYSALAIDMYGDGKHTEHPKDAMAFMQAATQDADAASKRFQAGLDLLKKQSQTDTGKLAAIGYCFGGSMVLNGAKLGLPVNGVVSFHGGLQGVPPVKGLTKAQILVCQGGADPFVPAQDVATFRKQLDSLNIPYTFKEYAGATHAFTNPASTANGKKFNLPIAYNPAADTASWNDMRAFFGVIFK